MNTPPFTALAEVYDDLMQDVPYAAWLDFVLRAARARGWQGGPVLELGCGTGALTERLEPHAPWLVAVDASAAMLAQAQRRLRHSQLLLGDMRTTPAVGAFALVVAVFDVVNNLLGDGEFDALAQSVRERLAPGGVWVFDVNTASGLESPWEGGVMEGWVDELHYRWAHEWDPVAQRARVDACWDWPGGAFQETHWQRPYEAEALTVSLLRVGFSGVDCYAHPDGGEPEADEPRLWVVASVDP